MSRESPMFVSSDQSSAFVTPAPAKSESPSPLPDDVQELQERPARRQRLNHEPNPDEVYVLVDGNRMSLHKKLIETSLDKDSPYINVLIAHDDPDAPLPLPKDTPFFVTKMFVTYLHEWGPGEVKVVKGYNLRRWFCFWIFGEAIRAKKIQKFALKQAHAIVGERINSSPTEDFATEIDDLWAMPEGGSQLREYMLDVYRCAGLCTPARLRDKDEKFLIELCENLQTQDKGGKGKNGLKTMRLADYED